MPESSSSSNMTSPKATTWRRSRWYDATPSLRVAMDLLYLLPSMQRHQVIERVLKQNDWPELQSETPLSTTNRLLPGRSIRRWYDQDPLLRQALDEWSRWPTALQQALGHQLLQQIETLPKL